ncbi:MAG TPA: YafY family protein [Chloroflexota bacterium]|nr:YafY family protein [Chloroflexota bacterium]
MYHPTSRVLTVLELLQAHPRLSGAALAGRLEVDRRTVRRYVTMLQDMGIPVEAERGRYGGYRLRPGYKLPPLLFTEDEALAITLGLLAGQQLGLAHAAPAVHGALAKVNRVMPMALRDRVRSLQDTLGFTLRPPPTVPAGGTMATTVLTLSTAAQQGRRVALRYRSWGREESERQLDPYGLVFHVGRWYVTGWDYRRDQVRVFRVDRILEVALRDETFTRPPDFDSVGHVLRSLAAVPYTWSVEVLLETTLEVAQQRVPPSVATLEQIPEGVVLRSGADRLEWMARFLLTLECPFVIRRPAELRDALRRLAQEIVELAERPDAEAAAPPTETHD